MLTIKPSLASQARRMEGGMKKRNEEEEEVQSGGREVYLTGFVTDTVDQRIRPHPDVQVRVAQPFNSFCHVGDGSQGNLEFKRKGGGVILK